MFGKWKKLALELQDQVGEMRAKLSEVQVQQEAKLSRLREQLAAMAAGLAPTPESIRQGLPYSEIPKEKVLDFIRKIPNLLILDVRGDEGWGNGYIPNAKHIPAAEVFRRLDEMPHKGQPLLTISANGNSSVTVCQLLAREGYQHVFNALGGMAGYTGPLVQPKLSASDITQVKGTDRKLISKVLSVLDQDVRRGLQRDGGDIQVTEVENGVVKVKMVGACVGCGAQQRTVEDGIKNHLRKIIPEIQEVVDLTLDVPR